MSRLLRVELSPQVLSYIKKQHPETRQRLRRAVEGLQREEGDIKSLDGNLIGYHRVRVRSHRIILRYFAPTSGATRILCTFVEKRSVVYTMVEEMLRSGLLGSD